MSDIDKLTRDLQDENVKFETYRMGDRFLSKHGGIYMLAMFDGKNVALIGAKDGWYWHHSYKVEDPTKITRYELSQIVGESVDEFRRIPKKTLDKQ